MPCPRNVPARYDATRHDRRDGSFDRRSITRGDRLTDAAAGRALDPVGADRDFAVLAGTFAYGTPFFGGQHSAVVGPMAPTVERRIEAVWDLHPAREAGGSFTGGGIAATGP